MNVSHHSLHAVVECELKAYLQKVLRLTTSLPNAPMEAGKAAHVAFAAYHDASRDLGRDARKCGTDAFRRAYADFATTHCADDRVLNWSNASACVAAYLAPPRHYDVLAVERPRERLLYDDVLYEGRLDLIYRDPVFGDVVVDFKTTQRLGAEWTSAWALDAQMTGYIWLYDGPARFEVWAMEWTHLPTSTRKCKTHGVQYVRCAPAHLNTLVLGPYTRTARQLYVWERTAIRLAERLRELYDTPLHDVRPTGEWTGACRRCEFRDWCSLGRHEEHLATMTRRRE